MVDSTPVSRSGNLPATRARDAFRAARDVNVRANVSRNGDAATEASLDRLRRVLDSGEPLSSDVPRGYYLNILV